MSDPESETTGNSGSRKRKNSNPTTNVLKKLKKVKPTASLELLSQTVSNNAENIKQQSESIMALTDAVRSLISRCGPTDEVSGDSDPVDDLRGTPKSNEDGNVDPLMELLGDAFNNEKEPSPRDINDPANDIIENILNSNQADQELGEALQEKVVLAFKRSLIQVLTKEQMDKIRADYKPPSNLKEITAPKVNSEIWSQLPRRVQSNDAAQQYLQQFLSRAMIAQARVVEVLTANAAKIPNEALKEILMMTMDGAGQMGAALREINVKRRLQIKPCLAPEVAGICGGQPPASEFLFGDQLEKDLTAMRASSKIVKGVVPHRPPFSRPGFTRPFRPYSVQQSSSQSNPQQSNAQKNLNWQQTPSPRGGRRIFRGRGLYHRQSY